MTEHPILFSAAMVNAILDGRKTVTRRVVNPQPSEFDTLHEPSPGEWRLTWDCICGPGPTDVGQQSMAVRCPYGAPGDRLYVKEAAWMWCLDKIEGTTPTGRQKHLYVPYVLIPPVYCATGAKPTEPPPGDWRPWTCWRYKTGRFLPRWASRLTLEVLDVRAERLQEITEDDAKAEGVHIDDFLTEPTYRAEFKYLWNRINGQRDGGIYAWDASPWVWRVEFRVVDHA